MNVTCVSKNYSHSYILLYQPKRHFFVDFIFYFFFDNIFSFVDLIYHLGMLGFRSYI